MTRTFLVRGMLVGFFAGLLALIFAKVVGEPWVGRAIAYESARGTAAGKHEVVSRTVQTTVGLGAGVLVFGAALGGLYGLVCAVAHGRLGPLRARAGALVVAAVGFVSVSLVPFLKYPANPPAIGNPDTIAHRTALYFVMIAATVVIAVSCVALGRWLVVRRDAWTSVLVPLAVFVLATTLLVIALPGINEVPKDFPAVPLYRFRLASLGINLVLWTALGLGFGWLSERALRATGRPGRRSVPG